MSLLGRRRIIARSAVAALIFIVVVLPLYNEMRGSMLRFYLGQIRGADGTSEAWLSQTGEAASSSLRTDNALTFGNLTDGLFGRLTGAEALIVSEKEHLWVGRYRGITYLNILRLLVPRVLRPWSSTPPVIPWETEFVGFSADNLTVVPMPLIIEAYLNFGVLGLMFPMLFLGAMYKKIDGLASLAARAPVMTGVLAYSMWRLSNIEHNFYIMTGPVVKMMAVVFLLARFGVMFMRARPHSRARVLRLREH